MSNYTHDDAMDALDDYLPADERDAVAAYIERIEAERDEAHRTAGKAIEDVRLEREIHVKATELLKEKVRDLEAEHDEALRVAEWLAEECADLDAVLATADGGTFRSPEQLLNAAIEAVRRSHE